jgi:hypothetical protein
MAALCNPHHNRKVAFSSEGRKFCDLQLAQTTNMLWNVTMICKRTFAIVQLLVCSQLFCVVYGQGIDLSKLNIIRTTTLDPVNIVTVSNITGEISVGVDPNNKSTLIYLLKRGDVVDDLQLSEVDRKAINEAFIAEQKFLDGSNGDLDALRRQRVDFIDELLTPSKSERLRQIAYRLEVAVLGISGALADGKLGRAANVYDNQKSQLLIKGEQFDAARDVTIRNLRIKAEEEVIHSLGVEQQKTLRSLIGGYFNSNNARELSKSPLDVENKDQLFALLMDQEIQQELSLDDKERASIQEVREALVRANRQIGVGGDYLRVYEDAKYTREMLLERILDDSQILRVKQLAYRIEICAIGLGRSLVSGKLSNKVKLSEKQVVELMDRVVAIDRELKIGIISAYEKAESNLLDELAPEQRDIAKTLLGRVFIYTDNFPGLKSVVARVREENKRKEESKKATK